MSDMRIGVVGLGWVAGAHIETFKQVTGATVAAVCSRRELDPAALHAQYGLPLKAYQDYEQMLANVADLPPDQRKSLIIAGLNELVFVMQLTARTRYGAQEEAVVSGIIKDGFRKLGS